jgi:hypothetical protein
MKTDIHPPKQAGDLVLQEVWRAKDMLSASYGHDLDRMFARTREHEKTSGHRIADLSVKTRIRQ